MINVVALFLVLSSLVTAGLWSPPPPETHPNPPTQDFIAKTGHQKLIVEFDKEDGNTKVSISPQESHISPVLLEGKCYVPSAKDELPTATTKGAAAVEDSRQKVQGALDRCRDKAIEVEERAKEAAFEALIKAKDSVERKTGEVLSKAGEVKDEAKDVVREASEKGKERASERAWEVKEAVGDATERAKETVTKKTQEAKEVARDVTQKAKEVVSEKAQDGKEVVFEKAQEAKEAVGDVTQKAKEKVSEKAQEVRERLSEETQKAKERVREKAENVQECAEEVAGRAKEGAKTVLDTSKMMGKDAERNVAATIESGKEKAKETAEHAAATAKDVMEEGEKDLYEILRRGREVGYDVLVYVVSPRAVEPAAGVVHLLGFAAAYGMCLWVTFVSSYVLAGAMDMQQFGVVQSKIYPVYFRTMAYCVALALFAHLLSHRKRMLANYVGVEVFLGYNLLVSLSMILFNLLYLEPRATKVMFERKKLEKEEGRGRKSSISEPNSKAAANPTADSAGRPARGADATSTTPFSKGGRGRETSISEPSSKSAADPTADSAAIPARGADATSAPPLRPEELEQVAARAQIVELSERLKKLNAYSSFLNILTLMHLTWHLVYLGQHLHVAC
ncbi:uncharacterized protein LOC131307381 isoform X1 [Rhododendron vialii]|uniref:uncharacterized protein LOC131307381 isoform X1 n=1 Tax=Rhododendron vialii TaxID=182163 RepID=UPI00265D634F|nr:uncharacterized protein LOC131307381 isoform X1 [Rhododendron vialii]XP_058189844.1 uncharacterized protein LOC131307381 isoform X1 [Rhododendron vialii]